MRFLVMPDKAPIANALPYTNTKPFGAPAGMTVRVSGGIEGMKK